jgi:hypothetical protein
MSTAAPAPDGWLHTGDLGRLGTDGYLYLSGRKGDMIIRGGENVYPEEVENRIASHSGIQEAAVVGAPHEVLGEEGRRVHRPRRPGRVTGRRRTAPFRASGTGRVQGARPVAHGGRTAQGGARQGPAAGAAGGGSSTGKERDVMARSVTFSVQPDAAALSDE